MEGKLGLLIKAVWVCTQGECLLFVFAVVEGKMSGEIALKKRSSKRGSELSEVATKALEDAEGSLLPDSAGSWPRAKRGGILGLSIHGVVFVSICTLLAGINVVMMAFTKFKFPWSLYAIVIWGSLLMMHYGITWSIFKLSGLGTKELDRMVQRVVESALRFFEWFQSAFMKGYNPFPKNSRLGRVWDFLLGEVDIRDDDY